MEFVDFRKHLQETLDSIQTDLFEVSNIRNMEGRTDRIQVVITALQGSVYKNSASIPYQIEVFCDDPDKASKVFTELARTKNNTSFITMVKEGEETKEYTVFEFYSTPTPADKQLQFGTNYSARLVLYATLNILFEVGNISKIIIDNEELEFSTGSITYATENFTLRESGDYLNKALKKASTTNLQLTMVNKNGVFTSKVFNIMFGKISGNTVFNCEITLTNGIAATLPMILNSNTFSFAQNTANLPSLNITLTLTRGA